MNGEFRRDYPLMSELRNKKIFDTIEVIEKSIEVEGKIG